MRYFADLHVHSRFSRATSPDLTLPNLHSWAQLKGLTVVGTGDATHPQWLDEISTYLVPGEDGLYRLRPDLAARAEAAVPPACRADVRFLLQGEVSSIYKQAGRVRRVHNLVYFRELAAARRFLGALEPHGNLRSDGRPTLGLTSREVLELLLCSGEDSHLVPAHIWTPWFSVLGSRSGFDSVEECFVDLADRVFAAETGLSSDPDMNRRVSALDRLALISNSDAHSPRNLGREANEFAGLPSYRALFDALRNAREQPCGFLGTLEFFPQEGKYHLDGHRRCGAHLLPHETRAAGGVCPRCGKPVTVGVLHRVEELADREEGLRPRSARPFVRLLPLAEIAGQCLGVAAAAQSALALCAGLRERLGPELFVLRDAPIEEVARAAGALMAEGVRRVREGRLWVAPGYDGMYGLVKIFGDGDGAPAARRVRR